MPSLYLTEPGSRLEKEYGRLLVTKDDEVLFRTPIGRVDQVVLVGRTGVTTPAMHALLQRDIPLLLISRGGRLLGRLLPPTAPNLPLRQAQYARNEDREFCLCLARTIVLTKIHNQRTLALRLARRHESIAAQKALHDMQAAKEEARRAQSIDKLMGIEGLAARVYFTIYRQALREPWCFPKRSRRPPANAVNALLSLGYSLLTQAMIAALEVAGLDPYLGYFHVEKYGRPALALDLVEEFRAPLVDSLTLDILNHFTLREKDFEKRPDGSVYLTPHGLRVYLRKYSERLESTLKPRDLGREISYRKLFEVQARRLARAVQDPEAVYRPFHAR
ncbi:MAG: CRISPR-associated endonuclease Cas1 [Candidatus Promineifilaceae bacterium]